MSNKNFSVLLMLIAPAVWCPYQTSFYILLITSETKKPPACTMYALAHRLYEYYYATNSYKVLQAIFLDYYATHENAASSSAQGRKIYMIPNYLHSKVLALFCSNMSNKNFSVLLMLIAPAVWYILLITPETKKPPACTMYSLAHRLYEYYNATHSYKVLQTIFLDYMQLIATKSSKPSSLEEGYPGGLDPHQKRMQPPALQNTSPLPSL